MNWYAVAYRLRVTPWERYLSAARTSIDTQLARVEQGRVRPFGPALDLGCGRGLYTRELAARGWDATGLDNVPAAVAAARAAAGPSASFVVGDVTALDPERLGQFALVFDVGCFQGLSDAGRAAYGRGVTRLALPDATLLMLAFDLTRLSRRVGGASRSQVESALPEWELLDCEPGSTSGLGWPMSGMRPTWYRFSYRT